MCNMPQAAQFQILRGNHISPVKYDFLPVLRFLKAILQLYPFAMQMSITIPT